MNELSRKGMDRWLKCSIYKELEMDTDTLRFREGEKIKRRCVILSGSPSVSD